MSKKYTLSVVESRGKIKKMQKILGPKFKVMASNGHIKNMPKRANSVKNTCFSCTTWHNVEGQSLSFTRPRRKM